MHGGNNRCCRILEALRFRRASVCQADSLSPRLVNRFVARVAELGSPTRRGFRRDRVCTEEPVFNIRIIQCYSNQNVEMSYGNMVSMSRLAHQMEH